MTPAEREEAVQILQARDQHAMTRFVSRKTYKLMEAGAAPREYDEAMAELIELMRTQDPATTAWWSAPCQEPGCNHMHPN